MKVRGLVDRVAAGASTLDFECPPGVEAVYRAQQFDADGVFVGWTDPTKTTLPDFPRNVAWVHNPLDPATSVQVKVMAGSAPTRSRRIPSASFDLADRSTPVVLPGTRSGLARLPLRFQTSTLSDADRFDALFGGYDDSTVAILCIRVAKEMRLPGPLFAFTSEPIEVPLNIHQGGGLIAWHLEIVETSPPAAALVEAALTYADFTAAYADYAEFTAAYADYTEASRDYSIAGTA